MKRKVEAEVSGSSVTGNGPNALAMLPVTRMRHAAKATISIDHEVVPAVLVAANFGAGRTLRNEALAMPPNEFEKVFVERHGVFPSLNSFQGSQG